MKRNRSDRRVRMEQSRRPKKNPLKAASIEKVDYKNINLPHQFISDRGKIRSRRVTGLAPQQQRQVATAVKNARGMAPLPFTSHQKWLADGSRSFEHPPKGLIYTLAARRYMR